MAEEQAVVQPVQENVNYANMKLGGKCGCQLCKTGVATTHNDDSHDQSLNSSFQLDSMTSLKLDIVGGTTKCGRVMSNYFASLAGSPFKGKTGIEVGSGTGIVGMTLAHLECKMILTDMEVALDVTQFNVEKNAKQFKPENICTEPLLWGEEANKYVDRHCEYVIGSDLIYAHENIPPLVETFTILSDTVVPTTGKHPVVYLAVIRRFDWEENFFKLMKKRFQSKVMLEFGDITIYEYTRLEDIEEAEEEAQEEIYSRYRDTTLHIVCIRGGRKEENGKIGNSEKTRGHFNNGLTVEFWSNLYPKKVQIDNTQTEGFMFSA